MRNILKKLMCVLFAATAVCAGGAACSADNNATVVYFTRDISPAGLIRVYDAISADITGKVAIKLHTGEPNGPNLLPLELIKALQPHIPESSLVETNVYYSTARGRPQKDTERLSGRTGLISVKSILWTNTGL